MAEYKVVIAEDEKLIRTGIAESIQWESLGAEVVGLAKNGNEAFRIIAENKTDILITDIQMSGGNGLDLIKQLNRTYPGMKVIIISGYNNFSYAQQAIQLGVKDYILKPINIEELQQILSKLTKEIAAERLHEKEYERYTTFYEENRQTLIDDFFRELLFGSLSEKEINKYIDLYAFEQHTTIHVPVVLFSEVSTPLELRNLHTTLTKALNTVCTQYNTSLVSMFSLPNEVFFTDITLVFSIKDTTFTTQRFLSDIKHTIDRLPEFSLLGVGIGEPCAKLIDLSFSYKKAKIHAMFSMISGLNAKHENEERVAFDIPTTIYNTTSHLYELFLQKDQRPLEEYLANVEKEIKRDDKNIAYKQNLLRNLLICVLSAGDELGVPVRSFFPDLMTLYRYSNLKTIDELFNKIAWACRTIAKQNYSKDDHTAIDLMDKAKSYILSNFDDPLLSLESVADYLSLTPSYFSKLFKKAYRFTYTEMLTSLRIDKAKKLLSDNPQMKISAVATTIGYNSPSYFNFIFKKTCGLTPREYQSQFLQ